MSKKDIDKLDQQISRMSNEEWQVFAMRVKKDLELATLRARIKKLKPSNEDILDELLDKAHNN